jgi:hypothetical protein
MSVMALVSSVTLVLRESTLQKLLLPLAAFSAGSLVGGALFHFLGGLCRRPRRLNRVSPAPDGRRSSWQQRPDQRVGDVTRARCPATS